MAHKSACNLTQDFCPQTCKLVLYSEEYYSTRDRSRINGVLPDTEPKHHFWTNTTCFGHVKVRQSSIYFCVSDINEIKGILTAYMRRDLGIHIPWYTLIQRIC